MREAQAYEERPARGIRARCTRGRSEAQCPERTSDGVALMTVPSLVTRLASTANGRNSLSGAFTGGRSCRRTSHCVPHAT